MSILEALRWRYATKAFDPNRNVSTDNLQEILEAGNLAPTSYGLQPFKLIVVEDRERRRELIAHSYDQAQVAESSHLIIVAVRTDVNVHFIEDYVSRIESIRELPAGAVQGYRDMMVGSITNMSDDAKLIWATKQAYIALGMMMTAAAQLEIDSCPMEGFLADQYDQFFGLTEKNLRSVVLLPIGYRAESDKMQHAKKVRWALSDLVENL